MRSLIQRKLEQLSDADNQLLSVASVQGSEFDSAVLVRVLGIDAIELEERLETLDRVHGLVRQLREQELADGTVTVRYQFVHILYQNALYAALQPGRARLGAGPSPGHLSLCTAINAPRSPPRWRSSSKRDAILPLLSNI